MTPRTLIAAGAVLLLVLTMGLTNSGCGPKTQTAPTTPAPNPQQEIQQIQNNPNMPAEAKQHAIAAIQAAQARLPKASQPEAPKH